MIYDFCIIGGGIAGLTIANELIHNSVSVVVVDEVEIGKGAGYFAAGMLAPLVESKLDEVNIVNYGLESLKYYPDYVSNLELETNINVGFKREGTLLLAINEDDRNILKHRYYEYQSLGLDVKWLSGEECREIEPNLSAQINTGILSKSDIQLNNRSFLKALIQNCKNKNVTFHENVTNGELIIKNNLVKEFKSDKVLIEAKNFVITCGAKSNKYASQCGIKNLVRPVKGQIIRLDQKEFKLLNYIIRTPEVYLVPKSDGSLVVGGSTEDKGFDNSNTSGEILELLKSAYDVLPGIYELPILELGTGFRPATFDNEPAIGESEIKGLYFATGYYRHGILFSPLSAKFLCDKILFNKSNKYLELFSLDRFY